jgi:hypothetical protein
MPGNNLRLDRAFSMGFIGIELGMDTAANLRPLIGLQVWLFGSQKNSEWVLAMAPRVVAINPEGLYVHWLDQHPDEPGMMVIPNGHGSMAAVRSVAKFCLYDLVRLNGVPDPSDEEIVQRASKRFSTCIERLAERSAPPPPKQKPWWED